eukprot:GHUV01010191.1.p1 GENE.GHUV01010191.1~~GHUV01010191.1.p1  ORF type:complete len:1012 (+),score=268.71 GHUV01010191.1:434-3469(+)
MCQLQCAKCLLNCCCCACRVCTMRTAVLPLQIWEAQLQNQLDTTYSRLTMANIQLGSKTMWAHWVFTFLFMGWIFTLLEYHTRQYAAVRQHYLRGGDDPNYWRDLHMAEADGTHVHKGAKLLDVMGAARFDDMLDQEEALLDAEVKTRRWYQRMLVSLTSWTGEEKVEMISHRKGASGKAVHVDLAHDLIQGDFERDAAAAAADAAAAGANGSGNSKSTTSGSAVVSTAGSYSKAGGRDSKADELVLSVPDSRPAAAGGAEDGNGGSSSFFESAGGGVVPRRVSTTEDKKLRGLHGEDFGSMVAFKWWSGVTHVATSDGKLRRLTDAEAAAEEVKSIMLAKPSVRYRKSVNAYDRHGRRTAVNAQQYAVLVTNVNAPCYPEFAPVKKDGGHKKPGAHTCGNIGKNALPPAVKYELQGQLHGHAERCSTSESAAPFAHRQTKDLETGPDTRRSGYALWGVVRDAKASGALAKLGRSIEYSLVANIFSTLFPDDYDRVVPVFNFRRVDLLMREWDNKQGQLETARFRYQHSGNRPTTATKACGRGDKVDLIDKLESEIAALEPVILRERDAALKYAQTPSWFVLFRTQKAAAIAASCNILPMNQDLFQVHAAPGPEEVNWQALWFNHAQRTWRGWATTPFAVIVVLLPVSLLTSAISQLNATFCKAIAGTTVHDFYCGGTSTFATIVRGLVTGFLPSLLITLWQGLCLPRLVYLIAQSEGRHYSLSAVDRRMGEVYFLWNIFNMFAQGVLGSAVVNTATQSKQYFETTGSLFNNPSAIPNIIGDALPASSKFFFTYIIMRVFMSVPLRFLITQPGVWQCWLRLFDIFGGSVPPRVEFMRYAIRSPRYGVEFGSSLLIMLIALAFSIIAPLIPLFGLAFFAGMWVFWRYQLIYNYQRKYEAGGIMWQFYVNRILTCVAIQVAFTGCVMIVKKGFVQASLLWVAGFLFIAAFQHRLNRRYMNAIREMPLYLAQMAPRARVPSTTYVPPPLQANGLGWYPEFNKVWEWFGMPGYSF